MDWEVARLELDKKLDPSHVKPARKFGPKGDYIEGWLAISEANRIFGHGGWSSVIIDKTCVVSEPRKLGPEKKDGWGVSYVMTVRVTIGDVTREDVGSGHGYDVDLGLAHESAIKEAATDALKRALRTFGNPFGLALYDKARANVGIDEPPFDPAAEAARMIAGIAKCATAEIVDKAFAKYSDTLDRIKLETPAEYDRIITARDRRIAEISHKEAA